MIMIDKAPSIAQQRNIDMLQQPRHSFFFSNRNSGKFQTINSKQPAEFQPEVLKHVPTMGQINKNKTFMDIETMNNANLNPRTIMNHAQATYGMARGQYSLITDTELNRPRKLLGVDNQSEIREQQRRATTVKINYTKL